MCSCFLVADLHPIVASYIYQLEKQVEQLTAQLQAKAVTEPTHPDPDVRTTCPDPSSALSPTLVGDLIAASPGTSEITDVNQHI